MKNPDLSEQAQCESCLYEIRIKGHLSDRWVGRFESMDITLKENGDTLLTGPVIDQAALHGLLKAVRDAGMPLISVICVNSDSTDISGIEPKIGESKMTINSADVSQRKAAVIAGISIVLMAITAGFAYGYVFNSLIVPGDAAATTTNLMASEGLFRAGIFGWLFILILDVVVAWGFYVFLKETNKSLSLLTAWLRLVYASILGAALLNLVFVLLLLSGADYLNVIETDQLYALVLFFLNAFEGIWSLGLVVFGCHLLMLGYVALKSDYVPKLLGVLLIIAAVGYLIVNLANLLLPAYATYTEMIELAFTLPMIIGELGFGLWLLIRGGKESTANS